MPYIFIGCCFNHKGFQCFDPSSKHVYISQHVIFDEGIFPAREQSIFTNSANHVDSSGTSNALSLSPSSSHFHFSPVSSSNPVSHLPFLCPDNTSPSPFLYTPVLTIGQPESSLDPPFHYIFVYLFPYFPRNCTFWYLRQSTPSLYSFFSYVYSITNWTF